MNESSTGDDRWMAGGVLDEDWMASIGDGTQFWMTGIGGGEKVIGSGLVALGDGMRGVNVGMQRRRDARCEMGVASCWVVRRRA